ncbi:hypothetical protein U9M48_044787 [Paspalum notatum var. saurae]|uniref:Uncharacterized protein n=1 Tax=Paspalum notatum var. saurae TaxID=547442 RepID=A0AAQ3V1U3_PASNO
MEKLKIVGCNSLVALEGAQSLGSLRVMSRVLDWKRFGSTDYYFLTVSFCKHLTSLQRLVLDRSWYFDEDINVSGGLTWEQALQLLTSLQELFGYCRGLSDLPVGLHSLPLLKRLEIIDCPSISSLPESGLPPSLEDLEVRDCSEELTEQCRMLATSKLTAIIDGRYVY